ncbi:MAG: type III pantothenate kinase [Alphaproteobacteria bacterium]|nr:type III pantothenate kinase [Alphaproteobacteria bacterium]MBT4711041.1 type III pantothenate kinase [Alphaproteobacteria bacterium]
MLIAIDSGNTNLVAGVFDGDDFKGQWRAQTHPARSAGEYVEIILAWLASSKIAPDQIDGAIIASVVPVTTDPLRAACGDAVGCTAKVVGDESLDLGLEIMVDNPVEVGADRLVNAVAAHSRYGGPMVIVDFGTATTFDVVDRAGNYRGGVIAPGVGLSLEALHNAAAKLPKIEAEKPPGVIGKNTVDAMQSGIYWGYVSLIEGIVQRVREEFDSDRDKIETVLATGGLASLFADGTNVIGTVDPNLTLCGLAEIYHRNA